MDDIYISEYPEELKRSMIEVHDRRLRDDFLPWALTRSQMKRNANGDIEMERLIQGLWEYGGRKIVVDVKEAIPSRFSILFHESHSMLTDDRDRGPPMLQKVHKCAKNG
ncbi:hypothetical protein BKA70DRAFT_1229558 [Coprinopsis sp. MPI-PUGE-AT-0042]|nr:hypothetical protein BKA70DRAFT_1229558 [Coprinopsis sp. MPI-PUGE-AT-0042]